MTIVNRSSKKTTLKIGCFVKALGNSLGLGKVVDIISDDEVIVEYFHSLARRTRQTLSMSSLVRYQLERQTRCYIWSNEHERWLMGRIVNSDRDQYEVDFPDKQSHYISQEDIYVRCDTPIEDPMEVLTLKGHETAFFHCRRSRFVKGLIEQRALTRGMTGLASSKIRLFAHQVEVVRRVLEDPIQRYLLADEVGLGKTIEAGIILRQYLLDNPEGRVLILTPPLLLNQWRRELADKFGLLQDYIQVFLFGTDEVGELDKRRTYGFLVVDEAQHIAAKAFSQEKSDRLQFQAFQHIAHQSERVLLLSATPVLNNEQDFLAMLHLLDPDVYKLQEVEAFRQRVRNRQEIGRLLLSLKDGTAPFVLRLGLRKLKELFSDDMVLQKLVGGLEEALETQAREEQRRIIRAIRVHIAESYRLHRRLLRNRRDAIGSDFQSGRYQAKGPNNQLVREYELDERAEPINELLDEWRIAALGVAQSTVNGGSASNSDRFEELCKVFGILFQCSGTWLGLLEDAIKCRLEKSCRKGLEKDIGRENVQLLLKVPLFVGEVDILGAMNSILRQPSEEGDRIKLLELILLKIQKQCVVNGSLPPKCVVFTGFNSVCRKIIKALYDAFGDEGERVVAGYLDGIPPNVVEEEVKRFKTDPDCFVLVCDQVGEEGRNFQFANILIHFDLPDSPNRLEQRIGRLDRIGRETPFRSFVIVGPDCDNSLHEAWFRLLNDGFGMFKESIASLQFYVEEKMTSLAYLFFKEGSAGLVGVIPSITKEIQAELVKINEQNALDEIDALDKSATAYFYPLVDYEDHYADIEKNMEPWICEALNLEKKVDRKDPWLFQYSANRKTLIPTSRLRKLAVDLMVPRTYQRDCALRVPRSRLLRVGEPLIDTLVDYVRWDDRGQAFAIWRHDQNWHPGEGAEWIGFRFDYVVEADLSKVRELLETNGWHDMDARAIGRRADSYFPPIYHTVYVDSRLQQVTDSRILEILEHPFRNKRDNGKDHNLTKHRIQVLDQVVDPSGWKDLCLRVRKVSETFLREAPWLGERCVRLAERATIEFEMRLAQLQLRLGRELQAASSRIVADRDLHRERQISNALLDGIRVPYIRLDSVGLMVVSGRAPFAVVERST